MTGPNRLSHATDQGDSRRAGRAERPRNASRGQHNLVELWRYIVLPPNGGVEWMRVHAEAIADWACWGSIGSTYLASRHQLLYVVDTA